MNTDLRHSLLVHCYHIGMLNSTLCSANIWQDELSSVNKERMCSYCFREYGKFYAVFEPWILSISRKFKFNYQFGFFLISTKRWGDSPDEDFLQFAARIQLRYRIIDLISWQWFTKDTTSLVKFWSTAGQYGGAIFLNCWFKMHKVLKSVLR